jgi:GNAT superfamily N-acetyltransferase
MPDDLAPLMDLYRRFYAEAVYKDFIEWDDARATSTVEARVKHHVRPHILAIVDGEMVGFICWELDHSFSVKPVAVLFEFYVQPEHRRSAIGRFLMRIALWVAKDDGACAFHAPIASGMRETAGTMRNMLVKEGLEDLGYIMRKKL